jgi:carboxymethylenebutenolidase
MCDEHTEKDNEALRKSGRLSRRGFGALAGAAGMALMLPRPANAQEVTGADVTVPTPDGMCDAYFVHPAEGAHAGVVMWPDIFGLRPAFRAMGDRLAASGYAVLVPNPFYRTVAGSVVVEGEAFGESLQRLLPMARELTPERVIADATALTAWLDGQESVDAARRIGVMGFCMSGPYTIRAAAALPERVGAGASFHGGGIATAAPDSPHLLAPQTMARFLFAIAQNDDAQDPESKDRLREAFGDSAEVEVYPAQHGWVPPDGQVYDEAQAERAWARLLALFETALA